jgi:hypothetical protein
MSLNLSDFRKLAPEEQNKYLEQICRKFLNDDDLTLITDVVLESLIVDETLKGLEMREDRYLKACQREGIEKLKSTLLIYASEFLS